MKTGDFITKEALGEQGYKFYSWFAGLHCYRRGVAGNYEYLMYNYLRKEIVSIFKSAK